MIGDTLGQYRIVERLGEGGMGEVYLAEDLKLRRRAALKIISAHLTRDEQRRQRFVQEALLAASVDHPHVAAIYDVDQIGDRTYIAMEYVQGQTLRDALRAGPLKPRRAIELTIQIADAVAKVHERGVVHRDLKPENVIVSADGYAKVIDFGLAKLSEPAPPTPMTQGVTMADPQVRTADGLVLGTVAYMSPEQARGEPVDARTDVFSFGALLHELLTGAPPFRRRSAAETLSAILTEPAPPPQVDDPGAAGELQRIVRKCLVKEAASRYQTMRDVVVDLREARDLLGTGERSPAVAPLRPTSGRRAAAIAGIVVIAAATAGGVWWIAAHRRPSTPPASNAAAAPGGRPVIAVMNFENLAGAADSAWLSKGLPSMLVTGLAQTPDLEVVGAERLNDAARELGKENADSVDRSRFAQLATRAGAHIIVSGSIVKAGADYRIDARVEDVAAGRIVLAQSVRGPDVLNLADELASRIREGLDIRATAPIHRVADMASSSVEAYKLYAEGQEAFGNVRFDDARGLFERAVAIDPAFSMAHLQLAQLATVDGDERTERAHLARAAEHIDRLPERDAMLVKAQLATVDQRFEEGVRTYGTIIDRYPDTESAYLNLLLLLSPLFGPVPDAAQALVMAERAVHALPSSGGIRNMYGYIQMADGRIDDALRTFDTYIKLRPNEANGPDSLADGYLFAGEPAKAVEWFGRAIEAGRASSRDGRAWAEAVLGRYDDALRDAPESTFVRAFMLSRIGQYKGASTTIQALIGRRAADANREPIVVLAALTSQLALERGDCGVARAHSIEIEALAPALPAWQAREWRIVSDVLVGTCEARAHQIDRARDRLARVKAVYQAKQPEERWWMQALAGEIALADGRPAEAAAAFAAGEPATKMPFVRVGRATYTSIFANDLPMRDGKARALAAQGRDADAIAAYRDLLTPGRASKWTAMLEPRYVLALAKRLDKSGQRDAARAEYGRFLDLWKHADADLPELADARRALER